MPAEELEGRHCACESCGDAGRVVLLDDDNTLHLQFRVTPEGDGLAPSEDAIETCACDESLYLRALLHESVELVTEEATEWHTKVTRALMR